MGIATIHPSYRLKTRVEIVSIAYGGRDFERELPKGK